MNTDKEIFLGVNYKIKFFLTFLSAIGILFVAVACNSNEKIAKGNEIIAKVENFRNERSRLPNSLTEIGVVETESGPVYCKKESESKYVLWFGKELGESVTYDSDTKQWK